MPLHKKKVVQKGAQYAPNTWHVHGENDSVYWDGMELILFLDKPVFVLG